MKEVEGRPNWVELEVGDVILSCDWFVYSDNLREVKMRHGATTEILHGGRGAYAATLIGTEYKGFDAEGICFYRRKPSKSSRQSNVFTDWWILGDDVVMEEGDEYLLTGFGESPTRKSPGVRMTAGDSDSFGVGDKVEEATAAGFTIWRKMK